MNYWPILLILFAIAMAIGPVMLMQPSSRSRHVAKLRQQAASLGLKVRTAEYQLDQQRLSVTVYHLIDEGLPKSTPKGLLLRQSYEHGLHFHRDWQWQSNNHFQVPMFSDSKTSQLREFLDGLPPSIVGLEINSRQVGLWWRENDQLSVVELKKLLTEIADLLKK